MTEDYIAAAARSWFDVSGERLDDGSVELLSGARGTTVCRLQSASGQIIAKRSRADTVSLERAIYDRFLNAPALCALRCHAASASDDHGYAWLFVDDAQGLAYDPRDPVHRAVSGEWLARLHSIATRSTDSRELPAKRPREYYGLLEDAERVLAKLMAGDAIPDDRRTVVDEVATHCRRLRDNWAALERACSKTPETLVHGDIVTHNARVCRTPVGFRFVLFDWEKSGWGTPAEDVSDIDLTAYLAAADSLGLEVSAAELRSVAGAGKAFRCLVFLDWLATDLLAHTGAAFEQLELCRGWLDDINAHQPWNP